MIKELKCMILLNIMKHFFQKKKILFLKIWKEKVVLFLIYKKKQIYFVIR